jgi:hypothetical protein
VEDTFGTDWRWSGGRQRMRTKYLLPPGLYWKIKWKEGEKSIKLLPKIKIIWKTISSYAEDAKGAWTSK